MILIISAHEIRLKMKQVTSKDYEKLFDLAFNQGFEVPCTLDYSFMNSEHIFRDFASVRKDGSGLKVGVRGTCYSSCDEFQLELSKSFKSVKEMFIRDCERDNLEWFDTFTQK